MGVGYNGQTCHQESVDSKSEVSTNKTMPNKHTSRLIFPCEYLPFQASKTIEKNKKIFTLTFIRS